MKIYKYRIHGMVPSKKNNIGFGMNGRFYKKDVKAEMDDMVRQLLPLRPIKPLEGNLRVFTEIMTPRRQDADNAHTTILDALQKARIIKNDYSVVEGGYARKKVKGQKAGVIIEVELL